MRSVGMTWAQPKAGLRLCVCKVTWRYNYPPFMACALTSLVDLIHERDIAGPCGSLVKNLKTTKKNRLYGKTCLVGKEYYLNVTGLPRYIRPDSYPPALAFRWPFVGLDLGGLLESSNRSLISS